MTPYQHYYRYPQPRYPTHLGALPPVPVRRPVRLMAGPLFTPQVSPCDPCGQECADYIVDTLRPFNPTPGGFALLALLAGGVIGYWLGGKA